MERGRSIGPCGAFHLLGSEPVLRRLAVGREGMRIAGAVLCVLVVSSTASAETVTIATFDDPSPNSLNPLFFFNAGTNQLSGGWSFGGLTLETIGGVFENATFAMSAQPGISANDVGAGTINFRNSDDDVIFTMDFDSALLSIDAFGATEFKSTNDVTFTGSILSSPVQGESFAFAFANQTSVGGGSYSATAAFTSSAEVIPEPITLVLLLVAAAGPFRRMARM